MKALSDKNTKKTNVSIILILAFMYCFYGINDYIDILICIFSLLIFIMNINSDTFYLMYFILIIFEPILTLPVLGGSFFRLYEILFFLKIILKLKNGYKFKVDKISCLFAAVLLITGLFYQSYVGFFSLLINIIIITIIFQNYGDNSSDCYDLLYSIAIAVFFSCIYGFFRGATINYGSFIRRTTTISDPNYSALFLNIGLYSIINNPNIKKNIKTIMFITMLAYLVLTVSISGLICFVITLCIYFIVYKKYSNFKYILLIAVLMISLLIIPFDSNSIFYGYKARINSMINGTSSITSGRTEIASDYIKIFKKLGLPNQLFGGIKITDADVIHEYIGDESLASHNSYIDMLFMTGIIGCLLIVGLFIYGISYLIIIFKKSYFAAANIALIKFIVLFFCINLSIFPFRYFVTFYMANIVFKKNNGGKNEGFLGGKRFIPISK